MAHKKTTVRRHTRRTKNGRVPVRRHKRKIKRRKNYGQIPERFKLPGVERPKALSELRKKWNDRIIDSVKRQKKLERVIEGERRELINDQIETREAEIKLRGTELILQKIMDKLSATKVDLTKKPPKFIDITGDVEIIKEEPEDLGDLTRDIDKLEKEIDELEKEVTDIDVDVKEDDSVELKQAGDVIHLYGPPFKGDFVSLEELGEKIREKRRRKEELSLPKFKEE